MNLGFVSSSSTITTEKASAFGPWAHCFVLLILLESIHFVLLVMMLEKDVKIQKVWKVLLQVDTDMVEIYKITDSELYLLLLLNKYLIHVYQIFDCYQLQLHEAPQLLLSQSISWSNLIQF